MFETLQTGAIHLEYLLANLHSGASLFHTATRLGERLQLTVYITCVCVCPYVQLMEMQLLTKT